MLNYSGKKVFVVITTFDLEQINVYFLTYLAVKLCSLSEFGVDLRLVTHY